MQAARLGLILALAEHQVSNHRAALTGSAARSFENEKRLTRRGEWSIIHWSRFRVYPFLWGTGGAFLGSWSAGHAQSS